MTEKHCLQCGVNIGVTKKRYCPECKKQRDREHNRNAQAAFRDKNRKGPKRQIGRPKTESLHCNPPYDCPNCQYSDCVRNTGATKAESEYLKAAKL